MCASMCRFSGPLSAHFDAHISHLGLRGEVRFGLGWEEMWAEQNAKRPDP